MKKRKTLPKDFNELIKAGDIEALKAVFDKCEINATLYKEQALSAFNIPNELVRWLVAQGADINASDSTYLRTPLHRHAMGWSGNLGVFLELGANVNAPDKYGETPLHFAASAYNPPNVTALLSHGANPLAQNSSGRTPLSEALLTCANSNIENMAKVADILLNAGTPITSDMIVSVTRIGTGFEFHRENFNKNHLAATDAALSHLYEIFGVQPAPRRIMHDGVSPIIPKQGNLMDQHHELWKLLIPSSGSAKTVQGEVIRITGRISDELYRNGGANWDSDYRKILDALLVQLASATSLPENELTTAKELAAIIRPKGNGDDEAQTLCELAVKWVLLNPTPIPLDKVDYDR